MIRYRLTSEEMDPGYSFTTYGGDPTLSYIMYVLPNLETLHFNTNVYKINLVCSNSIIVSFLRYSLDRATFDVEYLSGEDLALVLILYWQYEAYKAANNNKLSLAIERFRYFTLGKPYVSMSNRHEVTVYYTVFNKMSSPVKLIEEVGLLLTNLRIGSDIQLFCDTVESTRAMYQEQFLNHVFKYCSLLKKLNCSFFILESCNPELTINTLIEELVFDLPKFTSSC